MATVLEAIDDGLAQFVRAQHMFFVSTAPTDADGLVNVSPKGMDGSFAVLGPLAVAYLDLTGSGAETIAQRRDNGRICLMLRAFDGPPGIVRLHGRGTVGEPGDDDWGDLAPRFADTRGARAIIRVDVTRGRRLVRFAVSLMTHERDRDQLVRRAGNRGDEGLAAYRARKNAVSIDGLPALTPPGDG